jgi:hypothetical protein
VPHGRWPQFFGSHRKGADEFDCGAPSDAIEQPYNANE